MHKTFVSDVEIRSELLFHSNHNHPVIHVFRRSPLITWCVLYLYYKILYLIVLSFTIYKKGELASNPKEIIQKLRVLPNLRSLNLDHGYLGSEGSKVLFQWLSYGDDDGVDEENNGDLSRPPGLLQLTDISLTGACLRDEGFGALVGWLERFKKWHQMNMSISPSSSPDGICGLELQNVRLYFHFFGLLLIYCRLIPELYQWDIGTSFLVRLSVFVA